MYGPPGGAAAGPAVVERLSDGGSNDGNADDVSSLLGRSPSAVVQAPASGPGVTNELLVVSVNDRSEKDGIVSEIESTVIKESKVNVSTVVESELLDHGNDLQINVAENGKVNVVGKDVSNSSQNGVIENKRIPADDNDFDVSDDAKGITNRKRKLSTNSEDNINEGSAKVGNISLESEYDLSCEAGSPTPSPSVLLAL